MLNKMTALAACRRVTALTTLGLTLSVISAHAQSAPQPPALPSPAINYITTVSGSKVTFRLYAPNAKNVSVSYGNIGLGITPPVTAMTRDGTGTWTATADLAPNMYEYFFNVDGFRSIDTGAVLQKPQRQVSTSLFLIPGSLLDDSYNVPHGQTREVTYYSAALKKERHMLVYTPPGYDASSGRYPVLYFYHGGGDTIWSWAREGRGPEILDNLLALHLVKPMMLVMPDTQTDEPLLEAATDSTQAISENAATADAELIKDVVPYIDGNFRTIANGNSRAISGLSLGGIQALVSGLGHLGTFNSIISLSGGPIDGFTSSVLDNGLKQSSLANKTLREFIVTAGASGDIAYQNTVNFQHELTSLGFRDQFYTPVGYAHEFNFWRTAFILYTPTLFR
ncbi:alpha/beta hydrolase-fold protein [Lichenicola sp.]|uniref:alpha/beta hydrolase n=1 Tax=Lichenicola sp. TaxID=2804529 RepID=UPI003B002410